MKKLLIICMVLFSTVCSGQLFLTIEPLMTTSPGLAYVNDTYHFYNRVRYGKIQEDLCHAEYLKLSLGTSIKVNDETQILAGLNYNHLMDITDLSLGMDLRNIHPVSFEIGWKGKIINNFYVLALTDVFNWETEFGISIFFNK